MAKPSARHQLAAAITPHLPGYRIIPNSRNVDVPDQRFVQIALHELTRLPEAPEGAMRAEFVVTVVTPLTTPQKAEDDLDHAVGDLLRALDALPWVKWERATKVAYGDRHLGYDVTVYATTESE